jgi:type IV pilus assembly protein PilO
MGARRSDRLWLAGGLVAIIALVAASWFLVISPKFAEGDEVQAEAESTRLQLIKLNKDVAKLAEQAKQKATYQAKLETSQAALPTSYNIPAFLRQLQDSGAAVNVQVSGFAVTNPVKSAVDPTAAELPIALTAQGSAADLSRFFNRLQNVQTRAVLIESIGLTSGAESGGLTASIGLKAFCLQPAKVTDAENCKVA